MLDKTFNLIRNNIINEKFSPLYLISGEENYFIDLLISKFEKLFLSKKDKYELIIFYGNELNTEELINNCKVFPLFSEKKIFLIKEAQNIKNLDNLKSYFLNPNKNSTIIFSYKKKIDKRKKIFSVLNKNCVIYESKKIYDNQVFDFVCKYIEQKKYKYEITAIQIIIENIGNNLIKIVNEIDKLFLNINQFDTISNDLVFQNIGISRKYNNFELQSAFINKNFNKALKIIEYFELNPKETHINLIISILFNLFSKLLIYHDINSNNDDFISKKLKINPYFLKDYTKAASNYSKDKVINSISKLKIADLMSKGIENKSKSQFDILKEMSYLIICK